jgi:DNA primase
VGIFEVIKDQIVLIDVASRYTNLTRSGKRIKGCCPVHKESTPSFFIYPDGNAHCYGCGFHGDVIDLWAKIRGIQPSIEAALDLAREYSLQLPDYDPEEQKSADGRRKKEDDYLRQAAACHKALSSHPNIVAYLEQRGFTEEYRRRFLLGTNCDGSAVVIPFWHRGRVQSLILRQLEREPKYLLPKTEDFPSGYKPLFIPGSSHGDLILVEGYFDALVLAILDMSAISPSGTGISQKQKAELERLKGTLYIFPDADGEGEKAARERVKEFYPRGRLCPAEYGKKANGKDCKDVADLFEGKGEQAREVLEKLKAQAADALDLALSEAPNGSTRDRYHYAKENILPLLLRLEDVGERNAALEDVAKGLKLKLSELKRLIKAEALKSFVGTISNSDESQEMLQPGSERFERAIELLKSPKLLWRIVRVMRQLGHVGEFKVKLLAFICAASARMGRPIQPSTHAQSSAGKNALWDTVLSLFPPEMVIRRSGLSAKALFRTQVNLKGAVLYIQERAGSEAADYTIRVLQSDGRLEYEATEKAPDGSLRNVIYSTEGPTVIVQTTTKNHLHSENETRVFPIYVDESEEQTERIVQSILKDAEGGGIGDEKRGAILQVCQDAIQLLEPSNVIIPYAQRIVIPSNLVRIRRDARRLLDVVRVIAWLHQYQRKKDSAHRIIATEDDFNTALKLVSDSLTRAWQTLTPAEQKVMEAIQCLSGDKQSGGFKRRDLKVLGVSYTTIKESLKSLSDTGYLDCDGRAGPQGFTYTVARGLEKVSLGIYLTAQSSDSQQSIENKRDILDERLPSNSVQLSNGQNEEYGNQPSNAIGRNGHRPINPLDFQQIVTIGRTDRIYEEENTPRPDLTTQLPLVAGAPVVIAHQTRPELSGYQMMPDKASENINSDQIKEGEDVIEQAYKAVERGICPTCGREGILFNDCAECGDFIRTRQ